MNALLKKYNSILIAALCLIASSSCSTDAEDPNFNVEIAITQVDIMQIVDSDALFGAADDIITGLIDQSGTTTQRNCYDVLPTTDGFRLTFADCTKNNQSNLSTTPDEITGVINVAYQKVGEVIRLTANFDQVDVNGRMVSGTRTFEVNQADVAMDGYPTAYTINTNMRVILEDGIVVSEDGNKTLVFNQDGTGSYTVTGNWFLRWDADAYRAQITTALQGDLQCNHIKEGVFSLNKNGLAVTVDFGDGSCDNRATVLYPNGVEEEINLDNSVL